MDTIGKRIEHFLMLKNGGNQSALARYCGITPQAVQKWISGSSEPRGKNLIACAEFLNVTPAILKFGEKGSITTGTDIANRKPVPVADYHLVSAEDTNEPVGKIEYWDVRGSCGGGYLNFEQMPKGHLIREASFFARYGVKPENTFAIYADGDSMADFIVDGDLCIFDRGMTTPISGEIYAIEHPDGLRIKELRRSIDGSWTIFSRNQDKRKYPDEIIQPGQLEYLKIIGHFFYRQG